MSRKERSEQPPKWLQVPATSHGPGPTTSVLSKRYRRGGFPALPAAALLASSGMILSKHQHSSRPHPVGLAKESATGSLARSTWGPAAPSSLGPHFPLQAPSVHSLPPTGHTGVEALHPSLEGSLLLAPRRLCAVYISSPHAPVRISFPRDVSPPHSS